MAIIEDIEVGGTAKSIGSLRTAFPDRHPLAGSSRWCQSGVKRHPAII